MSLQLQIELLGRVRMWRDMRTRASVPVASTVAVETQESEPGRVDRLSIQPVPHHALQRFAMRHPASVDVVDGQETDIGFMTAGARSAVFIDDPDLRGLTSSPLVAARALCQHWVESTFLALASSYRALLVWILRAPDGQRVAGAVLTAICHTIRVASRTRKHRLPFQQAALPACLVSVRAWQSPDCFWHTRSVVV